MGEILGIGVTHFPGLMLPDAYMSSFLTRNFEERPRAGRDEGAGALARAVTARAGCQSGRQSCR
jgi:hypothetical protein